MIYLIIKADIKVKMQSEEWQQQHSILGGWQE